MIDWTRLPIGKICDIVNGGTPKTSVPAYWDGDNYWITPAEMGKRSTPYVGKTERTLTQLGLESSSARLLPPYSVILSSRAPIGHLVINTKPMATNQGCKGLVPRNGLSHKFLYYYLGSIVDVLDSLGTGATFRELSGSKLKEVLVPVPPLAQQQRIIGILDKAIEGIAAAKANAEKNLQAALAIFESHLDAVFTQRGEDWVETRIGQCIRFIDYRGKTPTKTPDGLRLITAKNVKMGYLQDSPKEFVSPSSYERWMTRGIPRRGDVLFTTEAPLGNIAQLDTDEKVVFAQRIIIMQPDASALDSTFLKYLLLARTTQQLIQDKGTGATATGIKASLLKNVEISFPRSRRQQEQIASKLDALKRETNSLESIYRQKLAALESLKKSLFHEAFSGNL